MKMLFYFITSIYLFLSYALIILYLAYVGKIFDYPLFLFFGVVNILMFAFGISVFKKLYGEYYDE